jgi:hypothetical protein
MRSLPGVEKENGHRAGVQVGVYPNGEPPRFAEFIPLGLPEWL